VPAFLEQFAQDLRYALRMIAKNPAFTVLIWNDPVRLSQGLTGSLHIRTGSAILIGVAVAASPFP
jgi:hypothetical protein